MIRVEALKAELNMEAGAVALREDRRGEGAGGRGLKAKGSEKPRELPKLPNPASRF